MKPIIAAAVFVLLFSAAVAEAACTLNPRRSGNDIVWDSPPGSLRFTVQEIIPGRVPVVESTNLNSYPIRRRSSAAVTVQYIITAELTRGTLSTAAEDIVESYDACVARLTFELEPDPAFRALTRKVVVPIVGSTEGAFGGRFRTALELRGSSAQMRGRIVFHPAGRVASDDDPSIPYAFAGKLLLAWDDVVEAMGQSGLGSLDIIPDEDSLDIVPEVTARLYNDTPLGTFGTEVAAVLPYSYLSPVSFDVPIPDDRFRVNIGIRTFGPTTVKLVTTGANGRLLGFRDLSYPGGWTEMTTAAALTQETLSHGASISMLISGPAVMFYSVTENRTNDPTVVLGPTRATTRNVGTFVD